VGGGGGGGGGPPPKSRSLSVLLKKGTNPGTEGPRHGGRGRRVDMMNASTQELEIGRRSHLKTPKTIKKNIKNRRGFMYAAGKGKGGRLRPVKRGETLPISRRHEARDIGQGQTICRRKETFKLGSQRGTAADDLLSIGKEKEGE